ncbi:MAG TPA: glycosyltransferase, partial [Myxococcales bacterium]|nr:glycosyltransferase [Myxococcales bacterium]
AKLVTGADSLVFGLLGGISRALGPLFGLAIALLGLRAVLLAVLAPLQARRRKPALAPAANVSVVVPAYNEEAVIARTVQSLLEQEPKVAEVVCVDDGSKDRTLAVLHEKFDGNPRVRIFGKPNGGKASALNLGFSEARGDIVVALDSDTIFTKETVAHLTAPFGDPRVGAVAGNAKVGNRVNRLTRWQALEYVTAQNLERRAWDLAGAVPVVPGAVGAWRRKAVLDAGGFHEDTLAEDTDLTLRLIAAGLRVVYAENALAYTEAPEHARALLKQRFRWTYGVLQACWKHKSRLFHRGGGVLGWAILPAFAVYQFVVPLVAPVVDILLVVSLVRGQALATAGYYLLFFALDVMLSAVAILLEGEDLGLLKGLFVQRIVYRQLLWVALAKSIWNAIAGFAVGWGKLARTGTVKIGA